MTAPTIVVDDASRWYGDVVALSRVSFTLHPGLAALLGPNGAGKTTLLRLLTGLHRPSGGAVRVLEREPGTDIDLYGAIGYVPESETLIETATPIAFVATLAALRRVDRPREAAAAALERVELDPTDRRPIRTYSKGMRQRVKVAAALAHDPQVLVLDEPLNGLDPTQRLHLIALFRELADEGRTVLVSSHVLSEVERLGSRVLVLVDGQLAAEGDFHAIRDLMDDRPRRIRVRTDDPVRLAAGLFDVDSVVAAHVVDTGTVVVDTANAARFRARLAGVARDRGARLREVVALDEDLESVFRYLVVGSRGDGSGR